MATFYYKAQNSDSAESEGLVQATTEEAAADVLIDKGMTILMLREVRVNVFSKALKSFFHISSKDLVIFSRQLSVLVSANVPLVQSLKVLIKQTANRSLKMIVSEIADEVEAGTRFSMALAKYPSVFDDFFINIIRSGETSGKLDEVLEYLATQREKDYELMSRIKGAMIYPLFVIGGLMIVGVLMMIFVIPKLTDVLKESSVELPTATKILIGTSSFLQNFWWIILLVLIIIVVSVKVYVNTKFGKVSWDFAKIHVPIFGNLFKKIAIVRMSRSLHTLLTGGITLTRSLEITSEVVANEVFKKIIKNTIKEVEDGNSISTIFIKSREIPVMVSQMLNVGEKTGRLDDVLEKISDFYSREIDNIVRNLVTLIEPMVMVVLGSAVAIMVAAIILPMYNLAAAI